MFNVDVVNNPGRVMDIFNNLSAPNIQFRLLYHILNDRDSVSFNLLFFKLLIYLIVYIVN